MAWLSFTELDKAVVHVIRLASFHWLWFQCVVASSNHKGVHSGKVSYAQKERKTRQEWVFGATASLESSGEGTAGAEKWKLKQCNEFSELHKVWQFWNENRKCGRGWKVVLLWVQYLQSTLQILYFLGWRLVATLHWGSLLTELFQQSA